MVKGLKQSDIMFFLESEVCSQHHSLERNFTVLRGSVLKIMDQSCGFSSHIPKSLWYWY